MLQHLLSVSNVFLKTTTLEPVYSSVISNELNPWDTKQLFNNYELASARAIEEN